jgi:hypothetical protein
MATWTMMITVTNDQWLELHKRTLDCVRAALLDLSSEKLLWEPEATSGATEERVCQEPRPFCIGAIVAHLCGAEMLRLGEVNIQATFAAPRPSDWNPQTFGRVLDLIQQEYYAVLEKRPKDKHILFGLGRMCQHNLYHLAQIVHLRCLQEPNWQPPPAGQPGSWEHAADFITDLLIFGDKATQRASQS